MAKNSDEEERGKEAKKEGERGGRKTTETRDKRREENTYDRGRESILTVNTK